MLLSRLLENLYRVLTASSGQEALEILSREEVSLVITDQRMPGMTGTELLRKIHETDPDMVAIVLTASPDAETLVEALGSSGASRYINKPWKRDTILDAVSICIQKHERNLENKRALDQLRQIREKLKTGVADR
jgi:response regulator RpfG family c-di-GMP phosphodiesterase